ncbi:hypothetical protein DPX16_18579 [Anabarilius grahami]|uniref:Uncharacterized protein n=1 Tax=Anabarilius grahami TaxID=495550 RepID=A0A3N0YAC5_ANAGA|nr:hypothetical protein DPX16_18579 [Anabarilius grahami]
MQEEALAVTVLRGIPAPRGSRRFSSHMDDAEKCVRISASDRRNYSAHVHPFHCDNAGCSQHYPSQSIFPPPALVLETSWLPFTEGEGKIGSLSVALSLSFLKPADEHTCRMSPETMQIMHPSLQFLDFSYLTLREKDRGHLPQKVNKNEIRHGTDAGGDCADALKHKTGCLSEDPKTLGAEMTFELQNRQITEAEIDGNTCFMY